MYIDVVFEWNTHIVETSLLDPFEALISKYVVDSFRACTGISIFVTWDRIGSFNCVGHCYGHRTKQDKPWSSAQGMDRQFDAVVRRLSQMWLGMLMYHLREVNDMDFLAGESPEGGKRSQYFGSVRDLRDLRDL